MNNIKFFEKTFPYVLTSREITDEEVELIKGTNKDVKLEIYNRVFKQNLSMCECPEMHNMIDEQLITTNYYQQSKKTVEKPLEVIGTSKKTFKKNDKNNK